MENPKETRRPRIVAVLSENFGLSSTVASLVTLFAAAVCIFAVVWFVRTAPPRTLTISSGRPGSTFQRHAESYQKVLATHGVTLRILPSEGSKENLQRLGTAESGVDIAFVQGGLTDGVNLSELVSLGSISYQPLWIFYRGQTTINRLSALEGKRIAIGDERSGTHVLALALLKANGITGAPTTLLDLDAEEAAKGLTDGSVDAVFLMGESAPTQTLRALIRSPDVQAYNFTQADAYVRRYAYLNRIELPEGSIDFGKNLPAHDLVLIGPTVELVARKGLNSALSDLLLDVAREVHGKSGLFHKRGEFPAPLEHEFKISDDAIRFYKSGKSFLFRAIDSFWLASLLNRMLVAFVPVVLLLVPAIRFLPSAYKWSIQLRFYRCYRRLLRLEQDAEGSPSNEQRQILLERLNEIEKVVNHLKVPASFGDRFYLLQGHIKFVRERLVELSRS
ncbi:MAG: TAXI family TRAP transporter solute-binding subunit [Nibricoccus sp.]